MKKTRIILLFLLCATHWCNNGDTFTVTTKKKNMSYQKQQETYGEILEDIAHVNTQIIEYLARAISQSMTHLRQLLENDKKSAFAQATSDEREIKIENARKRLGELKQLRKSLEIENEIF